MKVFSARFAQLSLCLTTLVFAPGAHADTALSPWSASLINEIKSQVFNQATCVPYLTDLEGRIDSAAKPGTSRNDLQLESNDVVQNLWQARLALHEKLVGADDNCAHEIRRTSVKLRYMEDLLAEVGGNIQDASPDKLDFENQAVPFLDDSANYLVLKKDPTSDAPIIQEGDMMMARGVSFLSATIAGIGDTQTQFSHVIFVVKDPLTQNLETIESYVDDGVNFHEFKWALKNTNSRLLVFRAKDQALAKKAAQMMQKYVADRGTANHIHYDYAQDFSDHTTMSCPEVPQMAFQIASDNQFNLPGRPSALNHASNLLKNLGIKSGPTFAPADLEGDERFEMVAEFRDLRVTRDSRQRDAIMQKFMEWMDKDGAVIHDDLDATLAGSLVWDIRHTPLWKPLSKSFKIPDFSPEIPRSMVRTLQFINDFGAGMLAKVQAIDSANEAKTGVPMTFNELTDAVDQIRSDDLAVYKNSKTRKSSLTYKYIRAK